MDGAVLIVCLSVAMFLGCMLLGLVPLLIRMSERSLRYVTILGAGLLCGTVLAVIIPEGVDLLEESRRAPSCFIAASGQNTSDTAEPPSDGVLPPHHLIGLALVVGFTFMFVVDQVTGYCSTRDSQRCLSSSASITATVGMVIHAAADGFALGAAMATPDVTVQVVVFFAVILHKAPAAFGLVSFLMHARLGRKLIQGHLVAFSAAAPVFAIGTYFILDVWGGSSCSRLGATGVSMLFSAGTFLYVATVHVFPEIYKGQQHSHSSHQLPQTTEEAGVNHKGHLGVLESLTLLVGVGIPMVLGIGLHD